MQEKRIFMVVFFFFVCFNRFGLISGLVGGGPVKAVYVLGDSLVDAGNNNYLLVSIAKANYPHNGIDFPKRKATGRFSNGYNAADYIAEKLGLPLPPPYLSLKNRRNNTAIFTGVNFASGGSGIFNGSDETLGQSIPLSRQVNNYISVLGELVNKIGASKAQKHVTKSIFVVVIGSNDLFDYFNSFTRRKMNNPKQYTQLMANKLKEQLKRLYNFGARKFLMVGIAQIGCTPGQRLKNSTTYECNRESNMYCSLYNEALVTMLPQLKEELNGSISYSYFDNFKAMQDIIAKPSAYGFTNVEAACCGRGKLNAKLPCLPIAKYCSNRTEYFFWDLYGHLTQAAAKGFVELMFSGNTRYSFPISLSELASSP